MIALRMRIACVAFAMSLLVAGCGGEQCVTRTTQYKTSVNAVGNAGATQGLPVARFDLTQDFVSHTPYKACAQGPLQDVGTIQLTVTSTASTPLAIEFDVQGLNAEGTMVWFQPGKIQRIMPGETLAVGTISVSPTHVDAGARVILTSVTPLP
jgi:hypothetical protein